LAIVKIPFTTGQKCPAGGRTQKVWATGALMGRRLLMLAVPMGSIAVSIFLSLPIDH